MGPTSSRMSTKRKRTGQSSSRSGAAREPPQQQLLPDDIERENAAVLNKLPRDVWEKVVGLLDWNDSHFQFALTCRYFRDLLQERADAERKRRREDARTTTWYAPSPERLSRKYGAYFETTLQSYTYISTHDFDDEMYSATIDDLFGDYHHKLLYESADHVKWLFGEARSTYCREAALATTPQQSSRERWDVTQGEQHVMELAAIIGDLGLIKWLRSQDPPCEWSKKACTAAAWANRWDLLRLLLCMGCPIDKEGM